MAAPPGLFHPTALLAIALASVVAMMILPVPAWLLDAGLAASFGLAILILTVTLFIERPLDFSAFPTVLLVSLILRLSLNVSSTKLIIAEGHTGTTAAGHVIEGFAMFIMSGSVILGLVIFTVLLIVNFMVITKGAGRMAEVGARFALDAMPGRQLAIDADVAAGAISNAEARARREREQAETTFFGSLDGASKFVKGDAVAGLLITLLNLVVGILVGTLAHGMPFADALETYAILTVGDGLVTQIPAVIISVAAAILLSRGGARAPADREILTQFARFPPALVTVAALMALLALVPGMPAVPFLACAGGLVAAAAAAGRAARRAAEVPAEAGPAPARPAERSLADTLDLDEIHVEFAPDLVAMILGASTGLDLRIANMRRHVAAAWGLILPEIRLTDDRSLAPGEYRIRILGSEQARDRLMPGHVLALIQDRDGPLPPGTDVREPVYGAPARWIAEDRQEEAALAGLTVIAPTDVLATHLLETVKRNFPRLLSLRALRRLIAELGAVSDPARAEANRRLVEELVPDKVPVELLLAVLRLLLEERVSIRNLPLILEAVAEGRALAVPEAVCEHVRRRLGFQLVAELRRPDGTIPLIQLAPEWEDDFLAHQTGGDSALPDVALPPERIARLAQGIGERVAAALEKGMQAAVVTTGRRRRLVRAILAARSVAAPVLSVEEIGFEARPAVVGVVPA